MNIHDRIRAFVAQEKISIAQFERELGAGRNSIATSLHMGSKIPHTVFEKIAEVYSPFTAFWILTGSTKDAVMQSCLVELKAGVDNVFSEFKKKL